MVETMTLQLRLFIDHHWEAQMKLSSLFFFFRKLGNRFIAGGHYNAKHTHWGSRLITQKGCALLKTDSTINAEVISTRKLTYWPTDPNKISDLLDFFIVKNISCAIFNKLKRHNKKTKHFSDK